MTANLTEIRDCTVATRPSIVQMSAPSDCATTAPDPTVENKLAEAEQQIADKDKQIQELTQQLKDCKDNKCPEVTILSIGDKVVFTGNSCDQVHSLADEPVTDGEREKPINR